MAFDLNTAKPAAKKGFDIASAKPMQAQPVNTDVPSPEQDAFVAQGYAQRVPNGEYDDAMADQQKQNVTSMGGGKLEIFNPFGENIETPIPLGSGSQKFLTGMGLGFTEVGRGIKRLTGFGEDNANAEFDAALTENSGAALGGKIIGNALPFLPAGLASVGGSALRNIGYQAAVGGLEGSAVEAGTGGSVADVIGSGLLGAGIGGGVQAASPYVSRLFGSLAKKYGFGSADELIDPLTGAPSQTALDILAREGIDPASLSAPLQSADLATAPAIKRGEEIAATMTISPARVAAHEAAGINAPIAALTDDVAAQEMGGALAAVHGSKASEALDAYTKSLTDYAKKITDETVGSLDSGAVSESLKMDMQDTIKKLADDSDVIYKKINELVPQDTIVNSKPILKELQKLGANRQNGIEGLSAVERNVFNKLKGKPTYADVDALRKDIGNSIGKFKGNWVNEDQGTLNRLYGQLTKMQEGVANQVSAGAGTLWSNVKKLDVARYQTQKNADFLFGENLAGGVSKKMESAISMLAKREPKAFANVMKGIPDDYKSKVLMSAMDNVMRKSYASGDVLDANGFAKFWGELSRSPANKKMLTKNLPEGAAERLDNMAIMAQSLANINKNKVRTGIIPDAIKDFNQTKGLIGKLYGFSQKASLAPSGAMRAAGVVADIASKVRTDAVEAADNLLASPEFRTAVLSTDKGAKVAKIAEARLKKTNAYKNYLNELNRSNRKQAVNAISSQGLIGYLLNGEEE